MAQDSLVNTPESQALDGRRNRRFNPLLVLCAAPRLILDYMLT